MNKIKEADIEEYMVLTQKTLDALVWYKRYSKTVLNVTEGNKS